MRSILDLMSSHHATTAEVATSPPVSADLLAELISASELWLETIASAVAATAERIPDLTALEIIEKTISQARARSTRLIRTMDNAKVARSLGATSTADLLRRRLRVRLTDARARVRVAATLPNGGAAGLETTADALARGHITHDHAIVIERAIRRMPKSASARQRLEFEAELNEIAGTADPGECEQRARKKLRAMNPRAGAGRSEHDKPRLTLRHREDGMTELRAVLDSTGGVVVRAALEPLAAPNRPGDDVPDCRPVAQRRADALVETCERALEDIRRSARHRSGSVKAGSGGHRGGRRQHPTAAKSTHHR
jgi:Domain of unknown function (DUF222)